MTTEHIKEQLSNRFIGILASHKGFQLNKPDLDYGVDYILTKPYIYINPSGKQRIINDGRYIDIQLKATTANSIIEEQDLIKYDLEAKTYNDLVERQGNSNAPLILILFVLPADENTWVEIDLDEIRLRKNAYWFTPAEGSVPTENVSRIRIEISKDNRLGIDCFNELLQEFYP